MRKISIYIRNIELKPSSYYRVAQYSNKLAGKVKVLNTAPTFIMKRQRSVNKKDALIYLYWNVLYYLSILFRTTLFLILDYIKKTDTIIISKSILPKYIPYIVASLYKKLLIHKNIIWDFDDHILNSGEITQKEYDLLCKYSNKIIVTNEFLKNTLPEEYFHKVILMPTTDGDLQGVDLTEINKIRRKDFDSQIRIVWVATSGNLCHLESVIKQLDNAAKSLSDKYGKKLILSVVCDKPCNIEVKFVIIENIMWTRASAISEIYRAHIGIMPLVYSEFALGKGGFKIVQYFSAALPAIASNVGFNKEVICGESGILIDSGKNHFDWEKAILNLSCNWEKWMKFSDKAYSNWKNKFNYEENLRVWNDLL